MMYRHFVPKNGVAIGDWYDAVLTSSRDYLPDAPASCNSAIEAEQSVSSKLGKIVKSEEQWRGLLTPEQYRVARQAGTESPFTGPYWNEKRAGLYRCVACGTPLFRSETKFESGTGWPSFTAPVATDAVEELNDRGHGVVRTEVRCAACESHLGHVFDDGPRPTGLRYCMNGTALKFDADPGK